jgi:hypothetical protein
VRIKVNRASDKEFALRLRIPGWAKSASVRINLRPADSSLKPGSYHEIRRAWQMGDVVDLDLPMPAELIEANPLVEETLGQVAMKRGPIVFCVESADLPKGVRVDQVLIHPDARFLPRYDQRLLGGTVVLDATLATKTSSDWAGRLYREFRPAGLTPMKTKLIPYCLWANRGKSEMSVWLPLAGLVSK